MENSRRSEFVAAVRRTIGTPHVHQGRAPGVAIDCAGVLICAARECGYVPEQFDITGYQRVGRNRQMEAFLDQHMDRVAHGLEQIGDALLLQMSHEEPHHLAVLVERDRIVHAYAHRDIGRVIEQPLDGAWRMRCRGVWRLRA